MKATKAREICRFCDKPFGGTKLICVKCRKAYCEKCRPNLEGSQPWCKLCQGEKVLSDQERKVVNKVTLYCTEGGSDKQYTMWVEEDQSSTKIDRWMVQAQWGRRGGTVQAGAKTPVPVSIAEARKVFNKVLSEKYAKGYRQGQDAPAFKQVLDVVDSGLRPMLLTDATDEGPERFIDTDNWGAQEKMNGKRILLKVGGGQVIGSNRRGLECPIPEAVARTFGVSKHLVLDGELVGEKYHAFDLLEEGNEDGTVADLTKDGASLRHERLMLACAPYVGTALGVVPLVTGRKDKAALVERFRKGRKEGIVFKKLGAAYQPGRIETLFKAIAVKCKFYSEGTFLVIAWNDKSSVQIAALEDGRTVTVGNVTVPEKYVAQINEAMGHDAVRKRVLIRVRYLYATPARILYQPNLDPDDNGRVVRDDMDEVTLRSDLKLEG